MNLDEFTDAELGFLLRLAAYEMCCIRPLRSAKAEVIFTRKTGSKPSRRVTRSLI